MCSRHLGFGKTKRVRRTGETGRFLQPASLSPGLLFVNFSRLTAVKMAAYDVNYSALAYLRYACTALRDTFFPYLVFFKL